MGRWTVAGILGLVAVIGVSLAAIREASLVWAATIPLLAGAILTFTAIMAILRRENRAARLGFAGLGIPYFVVAVLLAPAIGPLPAITPLIDSASTYLDPPPPPVRDVWLPQHEWMKLPLEERRARAIKINQDSEKDRVYTRDLKTRRSATRSIVHPLLSLVIGGIGALLASSWAWLRRAGPRLKKADVSCS
jgi:hypothetical protein